MTRLVRPNGTALLTLVAALFLVTWPFFGAFTIATLIVGLFVGLTMRGWYWQHPSTIALPDRRPGAEINLSAIPVRGDAGGLFFALGSVGILLGLPQLRWFLVASIVCAAAAGLALIAWRHAHESAEGGMSIDWRGTH
jgi:hypothetical protein